MPQHAQSAPGAGRLRSTLATDAEMADLIRQFVAEFPDRIRAIESVWASGDLVSLRRAVHQLKGACGGYGFPVIGEAAAAVETRLRTAEASHLDSGSVRADLDRLLDLCRRAAA